jgi:peptidoglycan/LPS O-acetylase OafA/YrhL
MNPLPPPPPPREYYPGLDSLRGIAILLVIFYHLFHFSGYFSFGWIGVDLFFVLSGFLITDILIKTEPSKNYLKNFYTRRALRIMPVYYFFLIVFFCGVFFFVKHSTFGQYYLSNQLWFWTYLQNWFFILNGVKQGNLLTHLWSLAVEEQFYLFWPLVVLTFRTRRIFYLIVFIIFCAACVVRLEAFLEQPNHVYYYYFNTFSRIDCLMGGAFLSLLFFNNIKADKVFSIVFIAGLVFFLLVILLKLDRYNIYFATLGLTMIALFFTAVLYFFVTRQRGIIRSISRLKFLNRTGKISYGMYIFHFPLYYVIGRLMSELSSPLAHNRIIISVITLFLTYFLSYMSYHYYEKRFLNFKKYFR